MVYLDSSALVKLVVSEPESMALRLYLVDHRERVSSALAHVEVCRAVRRKGASEAALRRAEHVLGANIRIVTRTDPSEAALWRAEQVLARIGLVALDEPLLRNAATLSPTGLRSLDAVHLATALSLDGLDAVVTYDRRFDAAASEAGLAVESPA